jgi:hypothetical protein
VAYALVTRTPDATSTRNDPNCPAAHPTREVVNDVCPGSRARGSAQALRGLDRSRFVGVDVPPRRVDVLTDVLAGRLPILLRPASLPGDSQAPGTRPRCHQDR